MPWQLSESTVSSNNQVVNGSLREDQSLVHDVYSWTLFNDSNEEIKEMFYQIFLWHKIGWEG